MKTPKNKITGIILAGGSSRRMGRNKALMRLGDETLIEHVTHRMQVVTDDLLLITNTPELYAHLGLPMHPDVIPDKGTLGGLYTGLTHANGTAAVCVGCDMPLLQPKLLNYLSSILEGHDAVVPCIREPNRPQKPIFQTLSAIYSKRCLPVIEQMLNKGELRVHALYDRISARIVEPDEWQQFDPQGLSFFNINTPEDLERARRMLPES
jgi:molybdenum cofactor guanylyltransferase